MIEFAFINKKSDEIMEFLKSKFQEVSLIESVNTFYRFKIEKLVQLSQIFGAIEPNVVYTSNYSKKRCAWLSIQ